MRVLAACVLALGLLAGTTAMAEGDHGTTPGAGNANASASSEPGKAAPATAAKAEPAPTSAEIAIQLQSLRELVEAQSKQLQTQQDKVQDLEHQLKVERAARENLAASAGAAEPAAAAAAYEPSANALSAPRGKDEAAPPTAISIKGITLTPGGFMAAETVWRNKALAADVNTPLNSAPFNGASNARMSEFQASGRQSRISMLVEGKLPSVKIGGYYEADFLSAGTTSNNNQSNSYTFRQRQFFAQAAFNSGWTITGGQMWSLLTETTHGMDNRTEALPQIIDAQYVAGFSWARQFGFRFTKNFNNKFWLGFSFEEPQATLSVSGNPTAQAAAPPLTCTTPGVNGCSATGTFTINLNPTYTNFLLGAFGNSGGLYNPLGTYAYNPSPDYIFKAVWEPGRGHYEVFGLVNFLRDRAFPCVPITGTTPPAGCASITSGQGAFNSSETGGGGGANARWSLFNKHMDLGVHFLGGNGIGRYGSVGLASTTVRPNGTIVPITSYQSLGTVQFHPTPKLDINLYVGGEYDERTAFAKSGTTNNEGYGAQAFNNSGCWTEVPSLTGPSTSTNLGVPDGVGGSTGFIPGPLGGCRGDTRNLIEGTIQFWYRFYKGPKGTVQYGMQFSDYVRNTWYGTGGSGPAASGQPHSNEAMWFTSFRYYLP